MRNSFCLILPEHLYKNNPAEAVNPLQLSQSSSLNAWCTKGRKMPRMQAEKSQGKPLTSYPVLVLIPEVRSELAHLHALQEVETCLFGAFEFA
jgi:hypothetical protein